MNSITLKNTTLLYKNIAFSVILAVIAIVIVHRIIPSHVDAVFTMTVSKNRVSITNIHQARDIELSKQVKIDRINLADKSRFRHEKLGDLGYAGDFFADINAPFTVKVEGDYYFYVASDDGFAFSVDSVQLCQWERDRPLTTDVCHVHLAAGVHQFALSYFQGYGNAGLIVNYSNSAEGKQYFAGENSKYVKFD